MPVKVAIVDSGIGSRLDAAVGARVALCLAGDGTVRCAASGATDSLGHGSAVASLVLARAPGAVLLSAQVFYAAQPSAARVIAAAVDWCVAGGARVINLSLGLRDDRRALRDSCEAATARGVLLVASHPARGGVAYPAAYPGVLAVNGDIRCGEGEHSCIEQARLLGASPLPPQGFPGGGASYATARIAGRAGAFFDAHPTATAADFRSDLLATARFHGRERRLAAA